MSDQADGQYGLSTVPVSSQIPAPVLDYRPRDPRQYRPRIGLIGCGGVTEYHLAAYRQAGYSIVALCDRNEARARARQATLYPDATVYVDYHDLLHRDDIELVDIATHPAERAPIIEDALRAGKHVLSQKPFVKDLDIGERLCDLAAERGVVLAVNQNGRWAPHFSYLRQALAHGLLGELTSATLTVHWDHSWTVGTPFEEIHDLILYDFAIHWFDIVTCFFGERPAQRVFAASTRAVEQRARPPMLAHVLIDYEGGQATLVFDATVVYGQRDQTVLAGTRGSARSSGPSLSEQAVTLYTADGTAVPNLQGSWFREGFHGTMAELLCAIEEHRTPSNNARDTLRSLALAFAAIASSHDGTPKVPGQVRRLPDVASSSR